MSTILDRDTESSDNGDIYTPTEPRSPTDASEDSVEVKSRPIAIPKNKRKSSEPSKCITSAGQGPIKKRIKCTDNSFTPNGFIQDAKYHFRPWQLSDGSPPRNPAELIRHPGVTTLHRVPDVNFSYTDSPISSPSNDEPLALIAKKPSESSSSHDNQSIHQTDDEPTSPEKTDDDQHNHHHHHHKMIHHTNDMDFIHDNYTKLTVQQPSGVLSPDSGVESLASHTSGCRPQPSLIQTQLDNHQPIELNQPIEQRHQQLNHHRNYKNMTRERRIEANARERTRVHTISAAFETLRHSIPSYSNTQKLSKLSVLRIASAYILTLSRLAGKDYSADGSEPSIGSCIDAVTKTIQTEGKIRKRKDE